LLLSRRCLEKSPCAVLLAIDKVVFESILEFTVYPLVFSVIAKEVPTMDPPDGSLAPLPGAEALFRVFATKVNSVEAI